MYHRVDAHAQDVTNGGAVFWLRLEYSHYFSLSIYSTITSASIGFLNLKSHFST